MRSRFLVLVAAGALATLAPGVARAHDLQLVVKLPPDTPTVLIVEAGFDDATPAEGARVTITAADGTVAVAGKTDERGVWKGPRPGAGKYTATVEAQGHRDKVEFEVAAADTGYFEFRGWRLDKAIGLALGVGGLLAATAAFWWLRLRQRGPSPSGSEGRG